MLSCRNISLEGQDAAVIAAMLGRNLSAGHAFISYVREDSNRVDQLQRRLEAAGIPVWRDTADLWPGEDWRAEIRRAISDNALVFIACFPTRPCPGQELPERGTYAGDRSDTAPASGQPVVDPGPL